MTTMTDEQLAAARANYKAKQAAERNYQLNKRSREVDQRQLENEVNNTADACAEDVPALLAPADALTAMLREALAGDVWFQPSLEGCECHYCRRPAIALGHDEGNVRLECDHADDCLVTRVAALGPVTLADALREKNRSHG